MVPVQLLLLGLLPLSSASPLSGPANSTGSVMFNPISGLTPITLRPQQPSFAAFDLTALPPARITQSTVLTALPPGCAEYVGPGQDCSAPGGMSAVSVLFEDCGDEFLVCRCADAEMSLDVVLERFGSVPVGLRRYAGTIVVLSDPSVVQAYTLTTGDTYFFGDCGMEVWVHELTHAFDFALPTRQTSATEWQAALDADTCVPDNYSQMNQLEDFAQLGVLMIYMRLHNGNLPPGFSSDCMSNQLNFMYALPLYNPETLFGNNCDISDGGPPARHSHPPAVLDPSRSFQPLGAVATSMPGNNARSMKILNFSAALLVIGAWAMLLD